LVHDREYEVARRVRRHVTSALDAQRTRCDLRNAEARKRKGTRAELEPVSDRLNLEVADASAEHVAIGGEALARRHCRRREPGRCECVACNSHFVRFRCVRFQTKGRALTVERAGQELCIKNLVSRTSDQEPRMGGLTPRSGSIKHSLANTNDM